MQESGKNWKINNMDTTEDPSHQEMSLFTPPNLASTMTKEGLVRNKERDNYCCSWAIAHRNRPVRFHSCNYRYTFWIRRCVLHAVTALHAVFPWASFAEVLRIGQDVLG